MNRIRLLYYESWLFLEISIRIWKTFFQLVAVVKAITNGIIKRVNIIKYGSQIQEIIMSTMRLEPSARPNTKELMCYPDVFPTLYILGTHLGCIFKWSYYICGNFLNFVLSSHFWLFNNLLNIDELLYYKH